MMIFNPDLPSKLRVCQLRLPELKTFKRTSIRYPIPIIWKLYAFMQRLISQDVTCLSMAAIIGREGYLFH